MITKRDFVKKTSKIFSTGRSPLLKAVDDALATYHTNYQAKPLTDAIVAWAKHKGLKANGNDINTDRNPAVVRQLVSEVSGLHGGEA